MKINSLKASKIIYFLFYALVSANAILGLYSLFFYIDVINLIISGRLAEIGTKFNGEFSIDSLLRTIPILLLIISYKIITKVKDSKLFFIATFTILIISYFIVSQATSINFADIKTQIAGLVYFIFISGVLTIVWKNVLVNYPKKIPYYLLIPIILEPLIMKVADDLMFNKYLLFANFINQKQFGYLFNSFQLDYLAFVLLSLNFFGGLFVLIWVTFKKVLR